MIEETILSYLAAQNISAVMEIPEGGIAPPCCVVERTGGGVEEHIRRATIAIQSYGSTLYNAAKLDETVVLAMEGIAALPGIASCTLNADYNFTDSTKKLYRYQAIFNVVYYSD